MQQHAGKSKLQAYERALTRIRDVQIDIQTQLTQALTVTDEHPQPTMRELAYIEGLRSERDSAVEEVRRIELDLFTDIVSRLGSTTDSVK